MTYDDVSRFAKQHGEVKIFPGEGRAVTVLTDGTIVIESAVSWQRKENKAGPKPTITLD